MAAIQSTTVAPWHALDYQLETSVVMARHVVPEGTLSAMWELESTLPRHAKGLNAIKDPLVTHFDYIPRYACPSTGETVAFLPRFDRRWVLTAVTLTTAGMGSTRVCRLHPVVRETVVPCPVGPMRRSDSKLVLAQREYKLGCEDEEMPEKVIEFAAVPDVEIGMDEWARLTVANGTKFVLEMSWGMGMSLVEADGSVDDGSVDDGSEEDAEEMKWA